MSFARKVRAGSGQLASNPSSGGEGGDAMGGGAGEGEGGDAGTYLETAVPGDRTWPAAWMEGEIGARKALRSDPHAFAARWQAEQEAWLGAVAEALEPGGRAAVMVGDGANINTRRSIVDAGAACGLAEVVGRCKLSLA